MRMVSTLYSFQIVIVVSMVWRPIHAVIQISCGSTINLNPSSALTYRFGDGINPYQTLLNCDISFSLSDASEQILYQIFPDCEQDADVLKINDGANLCCFGCNRPSSALISSFQVSLTTDSTTDPKELGFEIKIVTGKDESNCTASNPSSNISVSVGASPVIITSPNFPNQYPNNRDCSYIITPQDSSKGLSLTFDVISLDYDRKCYDYIELGIYNKEPYISICTNYKAELFLTNERYTSGGETYLHFQSDGSYLGYGFRVRIIQVDLGATQPPTAASTTAVQTVETTTSETTAASTTAAQTAETTTPSATVGTTAETTVKLTTSETTPTSETTAVPATVQSVSSTITASTAESTAVESTATPHTDPTTIIQISCGSTINLNPSSALTYRFGDGINPYQTLLNCDISFSLSDASEQILYQIFPDCEQDADVLKINDGANLCCFGCNRPFSALISSFRVSLTADSTTDPKELGFEIKIVTGKDESNCTASNPSSNISVSVGASPVIITSPNFPNQYPNNTDCSYIITPQDSSKGLSLTFDFISLDYDQKCNDYIELGIYNKEPYISICTNYKAGLFLTNERYTSGGETYLHFYSDSSHVGNGFRVRIIQVDLGATQPPTAATVQSVSSTITASTAESTATPHTDPTTKTIESNETTQDSTTATSSTSITTKPEVTVSSTELPPTTTTSLTSITTKPEVTVSSTELPPTTPFPKTTTTGFFGALTTPATVVALTGLVFLGVVPCFAIVIFCLRKKRKRPSRDNQSQYPYLKRDAQYYNTYHYPMTHKPLFYQYWGEY